MERLIKVIYAVAALMLAHTALAQDINKDESFDNAIIDAVQVYTDGHHEQALSMFNAILDKNPDNDAAWYYRGLCELGLDKISDGEESIRIASALDTSNFWYRERLAVIYSATNQKDRAIKEYESLIKSFPKKTDLYFQLANLYIINGDYDKAVPAIEEIENNSGKTDGTVMTKYRILLQQNKQEEAHASLVSYCEEYSSPQILTVLGDYEIGMYNDSTALAYYNEALSIDSAFEPAIYGKAEVFRLMRKYPKFFETLEGIVSDSRLAVEGKSNYLLQILNHTDDRFRSANKESFDKVYDTLLEKHPDDSTSLQVAAMRYAEFGETDKPLMLLTKAGSLYPESWDIARMTATVLISRNENTALSAFCEEKLKVFPHKAELQDMLDYADFQNKEYDRIISRYEEKLKSKLDSAEFETAIMTIGECYSRKGMMDEAIKVYEKLLKAYPDNMMALNNCAYFMALEGKKLKKAYKMSRKTVEAEPDNATCLDTFGWILHLMGRDVEARAVFKHAMLYGGKDSAVMLNHYADVLEALGENALAKSYRNQASRMQKED